MEEKKDTFIVVRIPKQLKDKVVDLAHKEDKNISKVVREILSKKLNG